MVMCFSVIKLQPVKILSCSVYFLDILL